MNPTDEAKIDDGYGTDYSGIYEESALTDENTTTADDGVDWSGVDADQQPQGGETPQPGIYQAAPAYPDYPDNPHNHRYTLSVTGDKAPMMVIRANTAAEMTAAVNELEAYGVWANVGAAHASMRAQGALGNGLGPVTPVMPQAPAPGPMAGPVTYAPAPGAQPQAAPPPFGPNVSVPQAPGYQGPPAQQSYQPAPPQTGGWGGNAGGGQQRQPNPQPPGWARANARSGPGYDTWKAMREQQKDYVKGKIKWGGGSDFWIEPSIAPWIAQQGFAVTQ